ncbi:MAG: type II secretion system minor pseudopilin GspK, partial [Verrucomicrobiota bacterium]
MKIRPAHSSDGIALIIALIAILVLSALAAGFALTMKVETRLAFNANSETQLYWLGRSGVELTRWLLAQEKCPYD